MNWLVPDYKTGGSLPSVQLAGQPGNQIYKSAMTSSFICWILLRTIGKDTHSRELHLVVSHTSDPMKELHGMDSSFAALASISPRSSSMGESPPVQTLIGLWFRETFTRMISTPFGLRSLNLSATDRGPAPGPVKAAKVTAIAKVVVYMSGISNISS